LKQVSLGAFLYAGDNEELYPERRNQGRWPTQLLSYYESSTMLRCPGDRPREQSLYDSRSRPNPSDDPDDVFRSFIINGWNDYFAENGSGRYSVGGTPNQAMPLSGIRLPSDTIVLGEKKSDSGHFYMDLLEPSRGGRGNDVTEIERGRHSVIKPGEGTGGSNYAMADGSARFIRFKGLLYPLNLWAVTEAYRSDYALRN
jgi:prepilin-type processing-associated H-X9-DG protein